MLKSYKLPPNLKCAGSRLTDVSDYILTKKKLEAYLHTWVYLVPPQPENMPQVYVKLLRVK
jgi:hypothetical protein